MSKQDKLKKRGELNYLTVDEFVERFSRTLRETLIRSMGQESNHVEDLAAHAWTFAETFYTITAEF